MKRRKIQIGLLVLIILMCCGINPKAWAAEYTWDGSAWKVGSVETALTNVVTGDQLIIRSNNARLTGLKTSAYPDINFSPNNLAETITLDVPEGIARLGNVYGTPGGHYILRAFAPTLALGNVNSDGAGGWLRLKHNTGGLGSGSITAAQLWADNNSTLYVDSMSCTIGTNTDLTDAVALTTGGVVVAANGAVIEFTIGNSSNRMTINGSIVTGANNNVATVQAVTTADEDFIAANVTVVAVGDADATPSTPASYPTGTLAGWTGSFLSWGADPDSPAIPTAAATSIANGDYALHAHTYKATWRVRTVGTLSTTPGTVRVIGTGTAAQSPTSDPSFVVVGSVYLNRYMFGTSTTLYDRTAVAYEVWATTTGNNGLGIYDATDPVAIIADIDYGAAVAAGGWAADDGYKRWTKGATTVAAKIGDPSEDVSVAGTTGGYPTHFGSFSCTDAALYIGGALSGGINVAWSDAIEGVPSSITPIVAGGTMTGSTLNLTGTEVHLGATSATAITAVADGFVKSTFSALPGANIITDENTSITFYDGGAADATQAITDFMNTPTGGRTLGSLYFKGPVTLVPPTPTPTGVAPIDLWSANLTLAGNLEIEDATANVFDITAMVNDASTGTTDFSALTASTLTVNGYVDLGKSAVHKFGARSNLVFNGAIRGWGAGVYSLTGAAVTGITSTALTALTDVDDVNELLVTSPLVNLTIGVNGQEHGDSVAALPATFTQIGNLTINRASCELEMLADLTVVGDLRINTGTLRSGAIAGANITPARLEVLGNTAIERGGVLNLNAPATATATFTAPATHVLGASLYLNNTLTVNGLLSWEGLDAVIIPLTVIGTIQPSQGTLQANNYSTLSLNGQQSYSLPASITDLNSLAYNIQPSSVTLAGQTQTLTLLGDLHVGSLLNSTGILRLAGYTLEVDDISDVTAGFAGVASATNTKRVGRIDATNGSTLDLNNATGAIAGTAYAQIDLDETTDLILRNVAWYVPATANQTVEFKVNNLTIIDDETVTSATAAVGPFTTTNGAGLVLSTGYDGVATTAVTSTVRAEIMGNLNLINNGSTADDQVVVGSSVTTGADATTIRELIVHGDVSITNNNGTAGAIASLNGINFLNFTTYGQVNLGGTNQAATSFITDPTTILNIAGENKRFEFPEKANANYRIGKLILNRPAGARFNNSKNEITTTANQGGIAFTHIFGNVDPDAAEEVVIDLQRGDLNLNGNNITFANAQAILQETAGNTVINTGTSYFNVLVHMPVTDATGGTYVGIVPGAKPHFTRGAILSHYMEMVLDGTTFKAPTAFPTENQAKSIGVRGVVLTVGGIAPVDLNRADRATYFGAAAFDWQSAVRRYPKGVFVPGVGISAQRYYYIKPSTSNTNRLEAYYDGSEVVGTENTMKFYIETVDNVAPTSDAFSNAEQLLGSTQIFPATVATQGRVDAQKFESGKSYDAPGGLLATATNGYLLAVAALPGGGGYKVWTGAIDSMWQVAGNWGPTPGAPGPLDQAIIDRSQDTIVITGTATCSDLLINGDDILIKGQRLTGTTANAILRTTGNIFNYGHSSIKGVDGNNRLDLQVNNPDAPIATGVMTTITSATEAGDGTGNTGIWFDNVTVTKATLLPSDGMRVSGNVSLSGGSTMQQAPGQRIVLYGPNLTTKTLAVPTGNAAVFGDIVLTNQAYMTTASDLTLNGKFDFEDAASIWESTDGTIRATYAAPNAPKAISDANAPDQGSGTGNAGNNLAKDSTVEVTYKPQMVWNNPSNARFVVNNIQIGKTLPQSGTSKPNGTRGSSSNLPDPLVGGEVFDILGYTTTNYKWDGFSQPVGTITVAGKFDKIGTSTLEPLKTPYVSGGNGNYAVVFSSNRQTEISNGAGSVLRIPNLIVTPNTKLQTNSSFNISNHLEVQANAEMLCNSGTITFDGKDEMTIINVSDRTLVMNNMNVEGVVVTPSSWKLAGNLVVNDSIHTLQGGTGWPIPTVLTESSFEQTAGTITIQNGGQNRRLVDNMAGAAPKSPIPNITFNKLAIDATSRLTTGPQDAAALNAYNSSFVIKNRAANSGMSSGIELAAGSGSFLQPAIGTVYFQTDGNILDTASKWIVNSNTAEKMQFGNIFIAPESGKNSVKTKSSFEVVGVEKAGRYLTEFLVAGGGASFEALEGTITFAGEEGSALITSLAPSKAQFASLRANNAVVLNVDEQTEIFVSENLIVDGTSSFAAGTVAVPARVELNGTTKAQHLAGTSNAEIPFTFTRLIVNKGANPGSNYTAAPYSDSTGVVVLDKNATISVGSPGNQSELILSNGIINLNNSTLTVGAEYITYQPGYSAIDGSAGKYIIADGHETKKLEDQLFTVAGSPTLYDLEVAADHQLANSLTVNNDLTLSTGMLTLAPAGVPEVVEPKTLTVYGDLIQTALTGTLASGSIAPTIKPLPGSIDNTLTRLILKGTGVVQGGLRNGLFNAGDVFSITVARGETLGGDLTMDTTNGANLTIQTGVNTFNLGGNRLTLSDKTPTANSNGVTVVSGSLAAASATVDFRNLEVVPANIFSRSEVGTINFGAATNGGAKKTHPEKIEIRGNVRVLTALTISPVSHSLTDDILRIYTGNNKLTLLVPSNSLDENHYIVGNLVMPVGNLNAAVFHVGNPETYTPVTMQLGPGSSATTTPEILATAINVDPTAGRGGNANNSINQTWTITPQAEFTDSLLVEFSFPGATNEDLGITDVVNQFVTGNTFAAKWDEGRWRDYRTSIYTLAADPTTINKVSGSLGRYSVIGSAALAGPWAVFTANTNTDAAKDDAIAINKNKIVVTELATPVTTGIAFTMTIALQDQYNQPVITANDLPVTIAFTNGGLQFAEGIAGTIGAIIPAGQSTVEVTLQVDNTVTPSNSPVAQIKVSADGTEGANWTPAITDYFPVIPAAPNSQAYDLTFTRATYTDVKVTWTNGDGANVIIIAKANGELIIPDEVPRNGVTYVPNMVYGAGSNIGDAVVLYNGPAVGGSEAKQSMDVAGLIPSTTYTLYAFAYNGTRGEESYNISSAQRNPNTFSTGTGVDDDIAFGGRPHSNDSVVVSATVGTNAPITGRVSDGSDYDCFNFTVTDEAPNVRVLLTNVPGDYTLELYDFTGRRIRRSTLLENSNEALVVNNVPAGTFVVKVFPISASTEIGDYKLLINTFSNEIFSVTPAPNME